MRATLLVLALLPACTGQLGPKPDTETEDTAVEGPRLVIGADQVDFGCVSFGELLSSSLAISNPGTEDLVLTSISVSEPFRVSPSFLTLFADGSSTITLFVQPNTYEEFTSDLTLVTDDETIGTVTVPLLACTITDEDQDGFDTIDAGGEDCDDSDADVNPDATETWYDEVDENCDGLNDFDQDGDGYEAETDDHELPAGTADCNDIDATFHPGAEDEPYDGKDTNCDDSNDWDYDGDGYQTTIGGHGSDCDDSDPTANRDGVEAFDGRDDDCDGLADDDALASGSPYIYDADGTWDRVGYSVAIGDLTGDGYGEIVVGSPYTDATNGSSAGRGGISVFRGPDLLPTGTDIDRADNYFEGNNSTDLLGTYVSVIGDYNGDGLNDLAVSATGYSSSSGAVYILNGDDAYSSGDLGDAIATYTGTASSYLGRGIGTGFDLDGDGFADLVTMYTSGSANYVALEYGSSSPSSATVTTMDAKWSTDGAEVAFYRNAPVAGDLDGDGYHDLVLSDGKADYGGYSDNGAMWVLWGQGSQYSASTADNIETTATTAIRGDANSDYDAWTTQLVGDADEDGDDELWVYNAAEGIYVIEGGTSRHSVFTPSTAASVFYQWNASSTDAEMIRQAGDWDGDGVGDVMVFLEDESGAYGLSEMFSGAVPAGCSEGSLCTYQEQDARLGNLIGSTDTSNGNVGYGMMPLAGDVDGDGDSDMVVGDSEYSSNAGQAYVLLNSLVE